MTSVPVPVRALVDRWVAAGQPSQGGFLWPRRRWATAFPQYSDLFSELPDLISRPQVRNAGRDALFGTDQAVRAFLVSMAWGYGRVGYGQWRTRVALTQTPDVPARLHQVALCVATEGGVAGYELLAGGCRIRGLGPAFGTKYLYFLPQPLAREPALILDRLVAKWLRLNTDTVFNPVPWAPATYRRYVETLGLWARELEVAPDIVEERIFVAAASHQESKGAELR